jgi:SAM-dependent methyltransferase
MRVENESWEDCQKLEASFWGDCSNTYGEETKQLLYAEKMGLRLVHDGKSPFAIQGGGLSYLDVGGGPTSMLLKFVNVGRRIVVDPCQYPNWVYDRYEAAGVEWMVTAGEVLHRLHRGNLDVERDAIDVALVYNVLQHVRDPEVVVRNARRLSTRLRMFEWIDIPPHPGHPHCLTQANLERWAGVRGQVAELAERECYGRAWFYAGG